MSLSKDEGSKAAVLWTTNRTVETRVTLWRHLPYRVIIGSLLAFLGVGMKKHRSLGKELPILSLDLIIHAGAFLIVPLFFYLANQHE